MNEGGCGRCKMAFRALFDYAIPFPFGCFDCAIELKRKCVGIIVIETAQNYILYY